jgi:hypothetical protein
MYQIALLCLCLYIHVSLQLLKAGILEPEVTTDTVSHELICDI